jgi:hypothetical protein
MGISTFPASSAGGIKSVQRGLAGAAGTVTITSVDITKSFVTVFGTTSTGAVAGSGTLGSGSGTTDTKNSATNTTAATGSSDTTLSYGATTITAGTTTLVSAVIQGYLSNSTSLVVSGACRWEVVEFN